MAEHVNERNMSLPQLGNDRISALESRYIELLETKIARLETQLADTSAINAVKNFKAAGSVVAENNDKAGVNQVTEGPSDAVPKDDQDEKEPRYKTIISKWNEEEGEFKDIDATKKEKDKQIGPENKSQRAFTFRKLTMGRNRYQPFRYQSESVSSEIEIEFKPLQHLLGKLTSKWGWSDVVTNCRSPYIPLVYAWNEAVAESIKDVPDESEDNKQARADLAELLKMLSTSSGYMPLDRYFKDRHTLAEERSITHSALFTLFPPGTLIVSQPFLEQIQVFSVQDCDGFVGEDHTFDLVCYSYDWNGYEFNRVPFQMNIPYWGSDRRSIIELPFYPLKYYVDVAASAGTEGRSIEQLREKLIKRGKKFVDICTAPPSKQMFKYMGDALFHTGPSLLHRADSTDNVERTRSSDDSMSMSIIQNEISSQSHRGVGKKRIDGTTMVDFTSFYEYLSANTPILGHMPRYEEQLETLSPERRANPIFQDMYKFKWDKHPPHKELSDEQYMMCPPRVLGYALKQKKWAQLLVDKLMPPNKADASTFKDKLQLEEESKNLVQKSVQAHELGKETDRSGQTLALQDFAPDKGKGLIIMLYGYPGVGKTLTAESVALMAGKPLLSVGVSDIGIEGDKVEANLQKIFDLAGKWEAVLLFDEADVFLEARGEGENDLRRNAMVSVLLRVLEYYDGILILTTNRMKSFDIAVQSRIHIAIKYEELSREQQTAIFTSFLEQLREKKLVENFSDLMRWVNGPGSKMNFNGRQIRNIVSTALGMAMMDTGEDGEEEVDRRNRKLKRRHLEQVADQTKLFKQDLKSQEEIFKRITR